MKTKVETVTVYVRGIKKRCRKSDFHSFEISADRTPSTPGDNQRAIDVAVAAARLCREMRTIERAHVSWMPMELEKFDGYEQRTCSLFNDDKQDITAHAQNLFSQTA